MHINTLTVMTPLLHSSLSFEPESACVHHLPALCIEYGIQLQPLRSHHGRPRPHINHPASARYSAVLLPSRLLQELDQTLRDTRSMMEKALEGGFFENSAPRWTEMRDELEGMEEEAYELRSQTHGLHSVCQELKAVCCGLSFKLQRLCNEVKRLRGTISSETHLARRRIASQRSDAVAAPPSYIGDMVSQPFLASTNRSSTERIGIGLESSLLSDSCIIAADGLEYQDVVNEKMPDIVPFHDCGRTPSPGPVTTASNDETIHMNGGAVHGAHEPLASRGPARHAPRVKRPAKQTLPRILCKWGAESCGVLISDISSSGIQGHLHSHHASEPPNCCQWHVGDCETDVCGEEVNDEHHLSHHVALAHLNGIPNHVMRGRPIGSSSH
ncbi:uncharacterized protein B0H18DRAFT_592842 [Fomitopsis serialis]|uniref:uncharacterized protein n=1 Tax=Fomitopsis serialis TaxID=139415 RepID=UPI0020086FC0|nr:uncharacterized protein B0H18DRAFT_592842 [Neoantrodia serialis]KAH9920446.1 hypothetical protein B0H18DRAFT_592842 [Neoantrodia serialis]